MDELNNQNVKVIENATRDDVLPGDRITWEEITTEGGVTRTVRHEGIAHHRDGDGDWCTEDGTWITLSDSDWEGVTITSRRTVQDLPTKPGTVIVPADGHARIEAVVCGVVWYANEAVLSRDGRWRGVWRVGSGRLAVGSSGSEYITPGTWKQDDQ